MATMPNLSALALEPHNTSAVGAGTLEQSCNPKKEHRGKCVRIRLHPRVFEAVRDRIDIKKMNAFTTSLVILGPFSASDPRYYQSTIADQLYRTPQWRTFRRWYLYNNERRHVTRRFEYGSTINVNPGYYGADGWTTMTVDALNWTWHDLFERENVLRRLPNKETAPHYEPGLFHAELCMEPNWDLKSNPDHTVAFIEALFDYNVDHLPYFTQMYAKKREEEKRAEERKLKLKRSLPASPARETNRLKEQRGGAGSSAEPAPHPSRNSPGGASEDLVDDDDFLAMWDAIQRRPVVEPDESLLPDLGFIEDFVHANALSA